MLRRSDGRTRVFSSAATAAKALGIKSDPILPDAERAAALSRVLIQPNPEANGGGFVVAPWLPADVRDQRFATRAAAEAALIAAAPTT